MIVEKIRIKAHFNVEMRDLLTVVFVFRFIFDFFRLLVGILIHLAKLINDIQVWNPRNLI